MRFDYLQLYVPAGSHLCQNLEHQWGFECVKQIRDASTRTHCYQQGEIRLVLNIATHLDSPVERYLRRYAPGITNIALQVKNLNKLRQRLDALNHPYEVVLHPFTGAEGICFAGWGAYQHTAYEFHSIAPAPTPRHLMAIDHVVLNIGQSEFVAASRWYQQLFNWSVQQRFFISTPDTGLYSEALVDSTGNVRFNLNHPTTHRSQIQTFLDVKHVFSLPI